MRAAFKKAGFIDGWIVKRHHTLKLKPQSKNKIRLIGARNLSKKFWPWKVTINRSNGGGGHTKLKKKKKLKNKLGPLINNIWCHHWWTFHGLFHCCSIVMLYKVYTVLSLIRVKPEVRAFQQWFRIENRTIITILLILLVLYVFAKLCGRPFSG